MSAASAVPLATASLRAVVVDDEPLARDELIFMLEQCKGISVSGSASIASEALELCANEPPDIVFVDLRMPGPDGFALSSAIHARYPGVQVVVVSAHDGGAIPAFEARVFDYLVKPVRLERLRDTVERIRALCPREESYAGDAKLTRLAVRRRDSYVVLDVADVVYFEVQHDLVWAITPTDRFALDMRLSAIAERVPEAEFFRSHRTVLVRIDRIRGLLPSGAGAYELVLDPPALPRVPLARERVRALRERIPFAG
jgi:two-component system response regulator LytT